MDITQIPDDQLLQMASPAPPPDISQLSDAQLMSMAQPQDAYAQTHQQMLDNASTAMASTGQTPTSGLGAQMLGYAANVEQAVPFMHEVGSGLAAAFGKGQGNNFGDRYDNLEQSQQALREAYQKVQPRIETPSYLPDITPSGVGQTGAALALTPLLPGPSKAAQSFWGGVGQGAGYGAGYGGLYGAGTTNAFQSAQDAATDRLGNALKGMVIGGGTGGLAGGGGYAIAKNATDLTGGTPQEIKVLSQAALQDTSATTPSKMAAALMKAKDQPMTLADVAGPNVQTLAEAIAQQPGEGMANSTQFFNQRNMEQPSRINQIIEDKIGPLDYFDRKAQTLGELGSKDITQAYNDAYSAVPKINDPQINQAVNRLVSSDVGKAAWRNATQAAALEGRTLGPIDAVGNMGGLSTYGADTLKKELDSYINGQAAQGNFDRMSPLGRSLTDIKNQLVSRLDEINPAYAAARQAYADPASQLTAMQMGQQDLWGKNWQKVIPQLENMAQPERDAFNSGVARKVSELMNTQAGDNSIAGSANASRNLLNKANVKERLQAAMGTGMDVDGLLDQLTQQAGMQDTANKVLSNSATARRQATQDALSSVSKSRVEKTVSPVVNYFANLAPLDRPATIIGLNPKNVEQLGANMTSANQEKLGNALQKMLFNPDYRENMQTLYQIRKYPAAMSASQKNLAAALLAGNGMATTGVPKLLSASEGGQ